MTLLVLLDFLAELIQGANNEKGDKGKQETPSQRQIFCSNFLKEICPPTREQPSTTHILVKYGHISQRASSLILGTFWTSTNQSLAVHSGILFLQIITGFLLLTIDTDSS